jgi:ABC-type enterobactin transport system permease subunit
MMQAKVSLPPIARKTIILPIILFGLLFVATSALQLKTGSPVMTWRELASVLLLTESDELRRTVVWEIRIPRLLLGLLTGAMLGAAGTIMQGAMNNRLAGPELLGVSSGASACLCSGRRPAWWLVRRLNCAGKPRHGGHAVNWHGGVSDAEWLINCTDCLGNEQ